MYFYNCDGFTTLVMALPPAPDAVVLPRNLLRGAWGQISPVCFYYYIPFFFLLSFSFNGGWGLHEGSKGRAC